MTAVAARPSHARWGMRTLVGGGLAATTWATIVALTQVGGPLGLALVFALTTSSFLVMGLLISERRRGNIVGPLVFLIGIGIGVFVVADAWVRAPGDRPAIAEAAFLVSILDGPIFLAIGALFLFFPDGRLPSPRWRILLAGAVTFAVVTLLGALARPGPLPYYPWIENPLGPPESPVVAVWEIAYGAVVSCVAIASGSLFVRWRRAGPVERAQLKWAAAAAVLVAAAMMTYGAGAGPSQYSDVGDLAVGITLGLFPIAIGIAVLRYRLYEIDRIISRTIGWAIVTGVLVAVFAGLVVTLQAVLAPVTNENTLAVAASTLVAFALFQPLRRRVQRAVDRRFDRARYDGQKTIDAFGERLRNEVDIATLRASLVATAGEAVRPAHASLWLSTKGTR